MSECAMLAYFGLGPILVPGPVSLDVEAGAAPLQLMDQPLLLHGAPEQEAELVFDLYLLGLLQPLILWDGHNPVVVVMALLTS